MSYSVQRRRRQPTRLPHPWDSPGKNTGVGCHFLLQCMKVKSESEIMQSCLTLCDPMDCSLTGCSVHGIFQARVLEWGAIAFSQNLSSKLFEELRWTLIGPHLSPHPNTDSYQTVTTGPFSLLTWLHQAFLPFCTFSTRTCLRDSVPKKGETYGAPSLSKQLI